MLSDERDFHLVDSGLVALHGCRHAERKERIVADLVHAGFAQLLRSIRPAVCPVGGSLRLAEPLRRNEGGDLQPAHQVGDEPIRVHVDDRKVRAAPCACLISSHIRHGSSAHDGAVIIATRPTSPRPRKCREACMSSEPNWKRSKKGTAAADPRSRAEETRRRSRFACAGCRKCDEARPSSVPVQAPRRSHEQMKFGTLSGWPQTGPIPARISVFRVLGSRSR